jgi:hypothetical protein
MINASYHHHPHHLISVLLKWCDISASKTIYNLPDEKRRYDTSYDQSP